MPETIYCTYSDGSATPFKSRYGIGGVVAKFNAAVNNVLDHSHPEIIDIFAQSLASHTEINHSGEHTNMTAEFYAAAHALNSPSIPDNSIVYMHSDPITLTGYVQKDNLIHYARTVKDPQMSEAAAYLQKAIARHQNVIGILANADNNTLMRVSHHLSRSGALNEEPRISKLPAKIDDLSKRRLIKRPKDIEAENLSKKIRTKERRRIKKEAAKLAIKIIDTEYDETARELERLAFEFRKDHPNYYTWIGLKENWEPEIRVKNRNPKKAAEELIKARSQLKKVTAEDVIGAYLDENRYPKVA